MSALVTIDYSDTQILETLRNTVAIGATPPEFALFLEYCKSTGLNPFKKEIWFIKGPDGRIQLMTGINGFWSMANSFSEFDGAETGLIDAEGNWVKSVPNDTFIGAWCRVYRKDRKIPMEGEALLSDYRKPFGLWKSAPRIMIKKVAESIALRKAFPQQLNGLYTAEEMPSEYSPAPEKKAEPKYRFEGKTVDIFPELAKVIPPVITVTEEDLKQEAPAKKKRVPLPKATKRNAFDELATFYDLSSLSGEALEKSRAYLIDACSKEVRPNVFRCPVKMGKLTSLIIPAEALEEGSQDTKEDDFPNV